MLNVGLLFHSASSDNLGVGALTVGQIDILRAISSSTGIEISVTLFDWQGDRASYVAGEDVSIIHLNGAVMKRPQMIMSMFKKCDLMIDIGAGDSFTDLYGAKRLSRMMYIKYLAYLSRCPMVLAPQTYGPFSSKFFQLMSCNLINRSLLVATRDKQSTSLLHKLGVTRPIVTASDVALRLSPIGSSPKWIRPAIGLNVSGLLMGGGYSGHNQFNLKGNYPSTMRNLIETLLALPDEPEVVLVPHVISPSVPAEDDYAASMMLQRVFPEVKVAPAFRSPGEAKAFISSLDFFAGARMHACIAAFSSDVPCVPLAYSKKFEGLFGSLEYQSTIDCRTTDNDSLVRAVVNGYLNRHELQSHMNIFRILGESRLQEYIEALSKVICEVHQTISSGAQAQSAAGHRTKMFEASS